MVIRTPRRHISYSFPVNLVGIFATVAAVRIIGWTIYAPVQWLNGCPRQVGGGWASEVTPRHRLPAPSAAMNSALSGARPQMSGQAASIWTAPLAASHDVSRPPIGLVKAIPRPLSNETSEPMYYRMALYIQGPSANQSISGPRMVRPINGTTSLVSPSY